MSVHRWDDTIQEQNTEHNECDGPSALKPEVGCSKHMVFPHKSRKTRENRRLLSAGTRRADGEHQLKHQVFLKSRGITGDNCVNMESSASVRGDTAYGFQ